jgi:DNA-binding XRE family transcriptional regulator
MITPIFRSFQASENFVKINAALIIEYRLTHALSQDELAIMSGLSTRTIQRVEKEGVASLQTRKALAAVLEIDVCDLDQEESSNMKTYEYKTIEAPFRIGFFKAKSPDFENLLNAEGEQGWRLHDVVLTASSSFGQTDRAVIIFERERTK